MKKLWSLLFIALIVVLAGCENMGTGTNASEERIKTLETEISSLKEEFTTFRGQWDGFYQDWGTYREEIGLGAAEDQGSTDTESGGSQ